tara:strand:- start:158 stop:382 length:225 start_codon:yes stop_codon:yes gene_type:complete
MIAFGVDIPLVELVIGMLIITTLLVIESIVLVTLLIKQQKKSQKMTELIQDLSQTILSIKKAEIEEIDKLHKRL